MIARSLEWHTGLPEPTERITERHAVRIADRKMIEAGRAGRRRASPLAFPCVETDVVMIAASAEERRRFPHALSHFEAKHAGIERQGPLEVRNFQVNVADIGAGVDGFGHIP